MMLNVTGTGQCSEGEKGCLVYFTDLIGTPPTWFAADTGSTKRRPFPAPLSRDALGMGLGLAAGCVGLPHGPPTAARRPGPGTHASPRGASRPPRTRAASSLRAGCGFRQEHFVAFPHVTRSERSVCFQRSYRSSSARRPGYGLVERDSVGRCVCRSPEFTVQRAGGTYKPPGHL